MVKEFTLTEHTIDGTYLEKGLFYLRHHEGDESSIFRLVHLSKSVLVFRLFQSDFEFAWDSVSSLNDLSDTVTLLPDIIQNLLNEKENT